MKHDPKYDTETGEDRRTTDRMNGGEPEISDKKSPKDKPRRRFATLRRVFHILFGVIIAFVCLLILAVSIAVWILTPERLTPLIENAGSEYLNADVKLDRAELTFWHTFPRLEVDVNGLKIRSRVFDDAPASVKSQLPVYADSLLSIDSLHAGVNVLKLLAMKIQLHDIEIVRPAANIVVADSTLANYDIFPPSEKEDTTATDIPDITLNRFYIKGPAPIRYYSVPDSMDIALSIDNVDFDNEVDSPVYSLKFDAKTSADISPWINLEQLPLLLNGRIGWESSEPMKLGLDDFTLGVGPLRTHFTTSLDAGGSTLVIESLQASLDPFRIKDLEPWIPADYVSYLKELRSDMKLAAQLHLTSPYRPALDEFPAAELHVEVPECAAVYQNMALDRLALDMDAHLTGNLNTSRVDLKKLLAVGEGVGFNIDARVIGLNEDPLVEGHFSGGVDFAKLPRVLTSRVPATVKGLLHGAFDFRFRPSYLDAANFHHLKLTGDLSLKRLTVDQQEFGAHLFSNLIEAKLGTDSEFTRGEMTADSLLTASLKFDSLAVQLPGVDLTTINLRMGVGMRNRASTASSLRHKEINPVGAAIAVDKLVFDATDDSMRVVIRDARARASLTRYEDHARVPLLKFDLDAGRLRYRDPMTRINFRETSLSASLHPRLRPQMSRRMSLIYDSIHAANPKLRADSVYKLAQAKSRSTTRKRRAGSADNGTESLDYGLDEQTKSWLKWIDFNAHLKSKSARLFTPYFPVKNRLKNVDLSINPDSLILRNTTYLMGHSDFLINGTISNLSRSLTSKRQQMRINFDVISDTIDINEIAQAAFDGAAFAEKVAAGEQINFGDSENDDLLQLSVSNAAASDTMAPLIIPINVDARIGIKARNVIYSNMLFKDMRGEALLLDGALNLHDLHAATDLGTINLSALYSAPRKEDLQFAFGLDVKDMHLEKFVELMPSLDTIMPLLRDIKGVINGEIAATTDIAPNMDIVMPSLHAVVKISGDSLVLLDAETFRTVSKWLLFKHKDRNMIDHMDVQMVVQNSMLELFPFMFSIDRYKLGVLGSNDLAMNLNYHVSVLKSPIPFKFGINLKGTPEKLKVRLGRAKFKEGMMVERVALADTTRINLINQIENVFRRGVQKGRVTPLNVQRPDQKALNQAEDGDTISAADSALFIREGLIPAPPKPDTTVVVPAAKSKKSKKR